MNDDSFITRWSRRKAQARAATSSPPPRADAEDDPQRAEETPAQAVAQATTIQEQSAAAPRSPSAADSASEPPPLTLDDVARLARDSDFAPFVARGVQPEVRNAALKKLFSDPHFNVMDGLDVYIDDYNAPDPLPESMLLKMAQAKFLGLVKREAEELVADRLPPMNVAAQEVEPRGAGAAALPEQAARAGTASDENADLQLQSHDAAGPGGPHPRAGEHDDCER